MDNKTLSLVSYITLIGWLIAFFSYKDQEKNSLVSYHLRQSFGLMVGGLALMIVLGILITIVAFISAGLATVIYLLAGLVNLGLFVLLIIGAINAYKGEEKPLPLIGKMFEGKFNFIP